MGVYFFFLGIWIIYVAVVNGYKFPENFSKCNLSDKNVDECLAKAMETYFHQYGKTGIASLHIPRVDPIDIPKMVIGAGTGAVDLVQRYSEVQIFGLSDTKIVSAHWDQGRKILNFTGEYPELRQEAKYNISGKVMMLAVYGIGDSTLRLKEPTVIHTITFKETIKNGKNYFHLENYSLNIAIKGAHYEFENMYDGDEKLAAIVRNVINDNWNAIFEDVRNEVEKNYGLACKSNANRFFDFVPFDGIFLS